MSRLASFELLSCSNGGKVARTVCDSGQYDTIDGPTAASDSNSEALLRMLGFRSISTMCDKRPERSRYVPGIPISSGAPVLALLEIPAIRCTAAPFSTAASLL